MILIIQISIGVTVGILMAACFDSLLCPGEKKRECTLCEDTGSLENPINCEKSPCPHCEKP